MPDDTHMSTFTSALPASALLISLVVPAADAARLDPSVSREVFQSASAAGRLFSQDFDAMVSSTAIHTVDGVSYSASQGTAVVTDAFLATTPPNGLGSTSFGYFGSAESAVLSFEIPITAFAIDINTFAPNAGDYVATLNSNIGSVASRTVYFGGGSVGQFLGFTSDTPFRTVTISPATNTGSAELLPYTLDTVIFGDAPNVSPAVPEPSSWVLLVSGLGLCGVWGKRRRMYGYRSTVRPSKNRRGLDSR